MEKKSVIGKNLLVLVVLLVLIGAVAAVALLLPARPKVASPEAPADVKAYLGLYVYDGETVVREQIIPLAEPGQFTIKQGDMVNVVEVTADSVRMHSSTCENQDCVLQGEVNLENRKERVLQNMILCLPHQVVLELYAAEEVTVHE